MHIWQLIGLYIPVHARLVKQIDEAGISFEVKQPNM